MNHSRSVSAAPRSSTVGGTNVAVSGVLSAELLPGLYDDLITVALAELIEGLDESSRAQRFELGVGDASSRLAGHVGQVVSTVLASLGDDGRVETGVSLVHDLLAVLARGSTRPRTRRVPERR